MWTSGSIMDVVIASWSCTMWSLWMARQRFSFAWPSLGFVRSWSSQRPSWRTHSSKWSCKASHQLDVPTITSTMSRIIFSTASDPLPFSDFFQKKRLNKPLPPSLWFFICQQLSKNWAMLPPRNKHQALSISRQIWGLQWKWRESHQLWWRSLRSKTAWVRWWHLTTKCAPTSGTRWILSNVRWCTTCISVPAWYVFLFYLWVCVYVCVHQKMME